MHRPAKDRALLEDRGSLRLLANAGSVKRRNKPRSNLDKGQMEVVKQIKKITAHTYLLENRDFLSTKKNPRA